MTNCARLAALIICSVRICDGSAAKRRPGKHYCVPSKYVKHIFDEKKTPDEERGSRVSDQVADMLDAGSPEARQGAQTMVQQNLPANVLGKQTTPKEAEAVRQYRSFVAEILCSS